MVNGPDDPVMRTLQEWRGEMRALFCEMREQFDGVDKRLEGMEREQQALCDILTANATTSKRFGNDNAAQLSAWFEK